MSHLHEKRAHPHFHTTSDKSCAGTGNEASKMCLKHAQWNVCAKQCTHTDTYTYTSSLLTFFFEAVVLAAGALPLGPSGAAPPR